MVQRSPVCPPSLRPPVKTYIIMVQNQNQETGLGTMCVYSFLPGCNRCRLEKAMAPHSSTLAWKTPWTEGPGWAAVHGVAKSQTRLSDFPFTFHFHAVEKEMATHSSALAWRLPGMGEPGGLPSVGSHRVGHGWSDCAAAAAAAGVEVLESTAAVKGLKF